MEYAAFIYVLPSSHIPKLAHFALRSTCCKVWNPPNSPPGKISNVDANFDPWTCFSLHNILHTSRHFEVSWGKQMKSLEEKWKTWNDHPKPIGTSERPELMHFSQHFIIFNLKHAAKGKWCQFPFSIFQIEFANHLPLYTINKLGNYSRLSWGASWTKEDKEVKL